MRAALAAALLAAAPVAAPVATPAAAQEAAAADPVAPVFVEEAAAAGLDHAYQGDWEYMVGGGVAVFDCDGNGMDDLYLAGGAAPGTLWRNTGEVGGPLRFAPVEAPAAAVDAVLGAWPLDVDSDGIADLVLLRQGENLVLRGRGDCRFARANEAWGFDGGGAWSTALAAMWEKGADWPTLAVGNYLDRAEEAFPWGSCTDNWLHRPASGGGWATPLPLTPSFCALSILFTDWNRSGTPALRVSNDREYYKGGQEQLWHIAPGAPPRLYTEAEGWRRLRIWGMGIAAHDVSGDGLPDYFLTSMADNKLQVLKPQEGAVRPDYADVAFPRGVTAHRPYVGGDWRPSTAWHAQFGDVNNDGRFDLFVVKGNVDRMPDFAAEDPNNLLLQRADGSFAEAGDRAGIASMRIGRGGAMADLNLDGHLDLIAVNRRAPVSLWRNSGNAGGNWLALRLAQPGANRDAIGAWVELRLDGRVIPVEVTAGGGHASGQLGWLHFGLGNAAAAALRVIWPDGTAGDWQPVAAGQRLVVTPQGMTDWQAR